jgi:anti-sigma regulatory factor (Ser/Thr protein kinase)
MRARGMPLGLLEGMAYEEKDTVLSPGDSLLMYSDGLIEAHNPENEMFSFNRLRDKVASPFCSEELVQCLLGELDVFTGPGWEQEDDVTLVTIERRHPESSPKELEVFELPSQPGKEMEAMERVAAAAAPWLASSRLERLKTAVAEAVMNAMEHGNHFDSGLPVQVQVLYVPDALHVRIIDHGEGADIPTSSVPDLEAKVEGLQPYRGWGLALIEKMVDEIHTSTADRQHTVELVMKLERKIA